MIVRAPRLEVEGPEAALRARIEFEDSGREPFDLRFGMPRDLADQLDTSSNAFVPLATLLAARTGEDVRLEAPASARMVAGAGRAAAMFADWWQYRPPVIHAEPTDSRPAGRGVAVMFSRGVDTSATLIRSLRGEIPERVTHLVSGHAIEWCYSDAVAEAIWHDHQRAADELELPLLRMTSNARDLLKGTIGWPRSFGAAYIGAALGLGPMLANLVTGATQPKVGGDPRGSRWDLDPLWSTEGTEVRQDAAELDRAERVAIVATHPTSVRWLKVCWEGRSAGNCGRCIKCLRTMTALAGEGVLEQAALFEEPLTPEAVRAAPISELTPPILPSLPASVPAGMPELRAAWEDKVAEWDDFVRRTARESARERRTAPVRRRLRAAQRSLRRSRRRLRRAPARAPRYLRRAGKGARRTRRRLRHSVGRMFGRG